jgi:hypothetical protein
MSAVLLSRFVRDLRVESGRIAQNAHLQQSVSGLGGRLFCRGNTLLPRSEKAPRVTG